MPVRYFSRLLLAFMLLLVLTPSMALAQGSDWRERPTARFTILYTGEDPTSAEEYAGFVDTIYDEMAGIFGHAVATPITLRLYPTLERYYEFNPRARGLSGVVAHADFRRNEVAVILPQTASQTPEEIQNNIRHELTHIIATDLSDNRLNVGFQEGLAQYTEHPSPELERKIILLKSALDQKRLLTWAQLDDREIVYRNAEITYPQTLSIIAFLVERYSFAKLRDFLTNTAIASGYRSALERTYELSPGELEQQWLEWLPSYLDGSYQRSPTTAYDLSRAEELLRQGQYVTAQQELETVIEWLRSNNQPGILEQAETLLERSRLGQQADTIAREARTSLAATEYERAAQLVAQAQAAYHQIGDTRQDAVLADYAQRAERGRQAAGLLQQASALADALRYPQARAAADQAMAEYTALGDRARAADALTLRSFLDQRQSLLGGVLLLLGIGGVAMTLVRRLLVREVEAW